MTEHCKPSSLLFLHNHSPQVFTGYQYSTVITFGKCDYFW